MPDVTPDVPSMPSVPSDEPTPPGDPEISPRDGDENLTPPALTPPAPTMPSPAATQPPPAPTKSSPDTVDLPDVIDIDDQGRPTIAVGALAGVVVTAVLVIATARFVSRLDLVIGLFIAAAALTVLTIPVRTWLRRWIGNAGSLVVTALLAIGGTVALAIYTIRDLAFQADALGEIIDRRIAAVDDGSIIGRLTRTLHLDTAVTQWLDRIPSLIVLGEDEGTAIATQLITLLMVVVLTAFLHSAGPGIISVVAARWSRDPDTPGTEPVAGPTDRTTDGEHPRRDAPHATAPGKSNRTASNRTEPHRGEPYRKTSTGIESSPRGRFRAFLIDVDRRGVGYVRRALVLALVTATLVGVTAQIAGMPGTLVLGLWAGAWFALPTLGLPVGLLPMVLLAVLSGRPQSIIAVVVSAAIGIAAIAARRRFIEPATQRLGVGPSVVGLAVGSAIGGVPGTAIGLLLMSIGVAAMTTTHRPGPPVPWTIELEHARSIAGVVVPGGWRGVIVGGAAAGAGVLVWMALMHLGGAIVWLAIGTFVAIALARPARWLQSRTGWSRAVTSSIVVGVLVAIIVAAGISGAGPGVRATNQLNERLPEVVADFENAPLIGEWLTEHDAALWVADQMNNLPQRLARERPSVWIPSVGSGLVALAWTALLAFALLIDGPRMLDAIGRSVPASHRRQYLRILGATGVALGGYAAGAALVASINGLFVFALALVLGIGLAPILGIWAFVWNFVPQIGGFMGGVPLLLFALIAGPIKAAIAIIMFIAYQFVENNLIQPSVIGAAIDIAPWGTLLAALAGGAAAGIVGAIVLTPLVGVLKVIRTEYLRDDFPGMTVQLDE